MSTTPRLPSAREAGLDEDLIDQIADHRNSHLPAPTKAALAWADVILDGGAGANRDAALGELRAHFDDAQVVELTYAIGTFIGYSKQIIALGLEPEGMPLLVIPTPGLD